MDVKSFRARVLALAEDPIYHKIVQEEPVVAHPIDRLREEHTYVAVLGRQGAGKSSLINSLLFTKEVLPIGVDETTNVLCKVVHHLGQGTGVDILFENGETQSGPCTKEFLRSYVDEMSNPQNHLKVKEVQIRADNDILSEGISFVDTPGVDSLTARNHEVTLRFLPKVSCAIFLFSTTPTLLSSEMSFLEQTWKFSQNFFFVQNVWGEDVDEIEQAQSDNLRKIRELAERQGTSPDNLNVFTVDVHAALEAVRNDNDEMNRSSGAADLVEAVQSFVEQGSGLIRARDALKVLYDATGKFHRETTFRMSLLEQQGEQANRDFSSRIYEVKDQLKSVQVEWIQAKADFDGTIRTVERDFDEALETSFEDAESELIRLVDHGKLNADKLEKAVKNAIGVAAEQAANVFDRGFREAARNLAIQFESGMTKSRQSMFDFEQNVAFDLGLHHVGENAGNVLEYGSSFVLGLLGMDALFAVGSAVVGAAAGGFGAAAAAAGAALAAIPVVGWIAAGAVLLTGLGLKAYFSGKKKRAMKDALQEVLGDARRNVKRSIYSHYQMQGTEMKQLMDVEMEQELQNQYEVIRNLEQDREKYGRERDELLSKLRPLQSSANVLLGKIATLLEEAAL